MAHRDDEHPGSMIGGGDAAPTSDESDKPARAVIARFGGIRPMAAKLGVAVTTVQGWKERGVIPAARHAQVLEAARTQGIALSEAELTARLAPSRQAAPAVMIPAPPSQAESPTPTEAVAPPAFESEPETEPESEPEPEPIQQQAPSPPATAPDRHRARLVLVGFLVILVLAGGAYGWWRWAGGTARPFGFLAETATKDRLSQAAAARKAATERAAAIAAIRQTLAKLEAGLAATRTRVGALDERLAALATARADGGTPGEEALAARVAALEKKLAEAGPTDGALAERVAALEKTLAEAAPTDGALAARVAALEKTLAEAGPTDGALAERVAALEKTRGQADPAIAALKARVATLEKTLTEAAAPDTTLAARVAALETSRPKRGATGVALVLALGQLRAALRESGPYAAELTALRALAGKTSKLAAALAPLSTHAATGIATPAALRARFAAVADAAVRASRLPADPSWVDRAAHRVGALVTVRRTGPDVTGSGVEARVARAEARLAAGDLAGAVTALDGVTGAAGKALAGWLADARARLAAERTLAAAQTLAIAGLAAPKPAATETGTAGGTSGVGDKP